MTTNAGDGETAIDEIDGGSAATTVMCDVPAALPLVPVMLTDPTFLAVTIPEVPTTAMFVSLLAHVTGFPVRARPLMSDSDAVIVTVSPTSREMFVGVRKTDATLLALVTSLWHAAMSTAPASRNERAAEFAKRTKKNSRGNRVRCFPRVIDLTRGRLVRSSRIRAHTGVHSYLRGSGVFR